MQVQQDNLSKSKEQSNAFLVVSTEEIRKIAENNAQPVHPNEEGFIESLQQKITKRESEIELLNSENNKLKANNKQLVKQLQIFSKKLDEELKRRSQSQQCRPKVTLKPEEKESIQIQNLYKKIEIYKKQVATLKSKLYEQSDGGNRINDYENKLKSYIKENDDLRDELKSLKKIIKMQEKGLSEIGAEGFLKITAENQKMKQELRKLRLEMDQVERKYRTQNMQIIRPKHRTPKHMQSDSSQPCFQRSGAKQGFKGHKQIIVNRKKNFSDNRIRTEPDQTLHKQSKTQENESELNMIKSYQVKIQKLEGKIRIMNGQKVRQRQIIENLKIQILQKDKEVNYLREKTESLRKMNKGKKVKENMQCKENLTQGEHSYLEAIDQMPTRAKNIPAEQQTIPIQDYISKPLKNQQRINLQQGKSKQRYPRLQEVGSKKDSSYKWNHHQFSSKIKQVQVYINANGSICHIHARYEKGEPNKSSELNGKKISALVCQATSEYVEQIRGGFMSSHLQYLVLKTNQKRVVEFGNTVVEEQCENFSFEIQQHEYPCALLGENDSEGVTRIGCFVQRLIGG